MTTATTRLEVPGYYGAPTIAEYIADPCPEPSLSTGVVCDLVKRTPLRAWTYHPRLGKRRDRQTPRSDLGSALHSLVLGGPAVHYAPPMYGNWQKKAAQEFRDGVREVGEIALLDEQRPHVERAADRVRMMLEQYGSGRAEQTMVWLLPSAGIDTPPVWCRSRSDWLDDAGRVDIDLKSVETLDPDDWKRTNIDSGGLDVQAGLRSLGHEYIAGQTREALWLLQEIEPPYDAVFVGVTPALLDLGRRKVLRAAPLWRRCLDTHTWPGYPASIHQAEPTPWAERDFAERGQR